MSPVKFYDNSEAFKKALKAAERATIRKTALAIAEDAKNNTPSHSGRTKNAFGVKMGKAAKGMSSNAKATVGVWSRKQLKKKGKPVPWQLTTLLERGTKSHTITAGQKWRAGKLQVSSTGKTWLTNTSSGKRFGKVAKHPGSKAYHMLENSANANKGKAQDFARTYYKKIESKLSGATYGKEIDVNTLIGSELAKAAGLEDAEINV